MVRKWKNGKKGGGKGKSKKKIECIELSSDDDEEEDDDDDDSSLGGKYQFDFTIFFQEKF